jgi:hypothetical protein
MRSERGKVQLCVGTSTAIGKELVKTVEVSPQHAYNASSASDGFNHLEFNWLQHHSNITGMRRFGTEARFRSWFL